MPDLLISNLSEVATPKGSAPLKGAEQGKIERRLNIEVICTDGHIQFLGSRADRIELVGDLDQVERLDGGGGTLIPGFVDPF